MSTRNMHLKYRTPKRYPTNISIVPPGLALIVTFRGSNYRCLEQIFMVPKGFEPSKFDCILKHPTELVQLLRCKIWVKVSITLRILHQKEDKICKYLP